MSRSTASPTSRPGASPTIWVARSAAAAAAAACDAGRAQPPPPGGSGCGGPAHRAWPARPGAGRRLLPPASRVPRRWELAIFCVRALRNPPDPTRNRTGPGRRPLPHSVDPEGTADLVVDLHDPAWPVLRRMDTGRGRPSRPGGPAGRDPRLLPPGRRPGGRFPDDDPAYRPPWPSWTAPRADRPGRRARHRPGPPPPAERGRRGRAGLRVRLTPEAGRRPWRRPPHHALLVLAERLRLPRAPHRRRRLAAGLLPHLPVRVLAWPSWPGRVAPAAGWSCSTRAAGSPWTPVTPPPA